jgi:hypothetical protein
LNAPIYTKKPFVYKRTGLCIQKKRPLYTKKTASVYKRNGKQGVKKNSKTGDSTNTNTNTRGFGGSDGEGSGVTGGRELPSTAAPLSHTHDLESRVLALERKKQIEI